MIREAPWYRKDAFTRGLKAAGFEVRAGDVPRGAPGNVLVIWNRYAHWHDAAVNFERSGGTVIVAENGYLGTGGTSPKFDVHPGGPKPHHYYALGLGYHNDDRRIVTGTTDRFSALGVTLKPWRNHGDYVLVLANRSFGIPGRMMPANWAEQVKKKLELQTKRPIRVRVHPGNNAPVQNPLAVDLKNAWAAVIWSSSAGIHALAEGVPVFCEGPNWIMKSAAAQGSIDDAVMPSPRPAFERMAWAQWQIQEIETGEPFRHLLRAA